MAFGTRKGRWVAAGAACAGILALVVGWAVARRGTPGPLDEARASYRAGAYREALTRANARLRDAPGDADAMRISARASARLGRDAAALDLFQRLGSDGAAGEDLFLLGNTLIRQGRPADGERMLLLALKTEPAHGETLEVLTRLYESSDRMAEAAELAARLAEVPDRSGTGYNRLGRALDRVGDFEGAATAFGSALKRGEGADSLPSFKNFARALLKLGRAKEAEKALGRIGPLARDAEAEWLIGRAALQRGDKAETLRAGQRTAAASGDEPLAASVRFGPEPAPYVGAARCAECHREEHDAQQSSRHARTFHRGPAIEALALPTAEFIDSKTPEVVASYRADGLKVSVGEDIYRAVVDYVLGSGRHALMPVGHDEAGATRELRLTYYASIQAWDRTPGQPVKPGEPAGYLGERQSADSLRRCLGCHTTNPRHALAPATASKGPEALDKGIGCEKCHGPGGNHVAAVAVGVPDLAVGRFRPTSDGLRPRVMTVCGECHGTQGRALPQDSPAATVRFQGTTLTWSRCFEESRGKLDCITCHPAHRDSEETPSFYEAKCLECHAPASSGKVPCKVNPRNGCLDCHMPRVPSIVPHATFTDHHIRVRKPEETPSAAGSKGGP